MRKNERLVKSLISKWQSKLLLDSWNISLRMDKEKTNENGAVGTCAVDHIYKNANMVIYQDAFKKPNDIDHIVLHELCHCITEPLYLYCFDLLNAKLRTHKDIEEQREMMTEHFAKIIKGMK